MADMLTLKTGYGDDAVARLPTQFRGKPRFEALLRALCDEAEALEAGLFSLYSGRQLDTATGAALDVLGRIVGEERVGLADEPFRLRIRAAIATNKSSGTGNELLRIFGLLTTLPAQLREEFPHSLAMSVGGSALAYPEVFADVLRRAKGGGIRAVLEWLEAPEADTFTLDSEEEWQGFSADGGVVLGARDDSAVDPIITTATGPVLSIGTVSGVTGDVLVRLNGAGGAPSSVDYDVSFDGGATYTAIANSSSLPRDFGNGLVLTTFGTDDGFYIGGEVYRWPATIVAPVVGGILASCAQAKR